MLRFISLAVLVLWMVAGCGSELSSVDSPLPQPLAVVPEAENEFGTGYEEPPAAVTDAWPGALPPEVESPLPLAFEAPSSVNITAPPVQAQGGLGACVSFGTGYELLSTVAGQGQRDLTDLAQCSSSAWGYINALNLEGKPLTHGPGTLAITYLETAVNVGAVSWATLPYPSPTPVSAMIANLTAINASFSQYAPSSQFQLGGWGVVDNTVSALKAELAQGHPMSIGIAVPEGFGHYKGGLFSPSPQPSPGGGHNIFLKGYDDSQGAFIIQNSWGRRWGVEGNCYWAYDSLPNFMLKRSAHTARPVSAEPLDPETGGASADGTLTVVRAHQAVNRDGRVHLVPLVRLQPALKVLRYTIVSPSGRRATVTHGFMLRSGHLYLSRADNRQWPAGSYTLTVDGLAPDGAAVTKSVRFTVRGLANLPAADTPPGVTGSNRLPVVVE